MFFSKYLFAATLLIISTHSIAQVNLDGKASCESNTIFVSADFDSARVNHCEIEDETISIKIKPENKPINDSPWYAFKVHAKTSTEVRVRIKYYGGKHRYHPKFSVDGIHWQTLPYQLKKGVLVFKLSIGEQPVFIAGQEIVSNHAYENWIKATANQFQ